MRPQVHAEVVIVDSTIVGSRSTQLAGPAATFCSREVHSLAEISSVFSQVIFDLSSQASDWVGCYFGQESRIEVEYLEKQ